MKCSTVHRDYTLANEMVESGVKARGMDESHAIVPYFMNTIFRISFISPGTVA
jgi:hypothetical protein